MGETGDCVSFALGKVEPCVCTMVVLLGDGVGPGVMVVKFVGLADASLVFACECVSEARNG